MRQSKRVRTTRRVAVPIVRLCASHDRCIVYSLRQRLGLQIYQCSAGEDVRTAAGFEISSWVGLLHLRTTLSPHEYIREAGRVPL